MHLLAEICDETKETLKMQNFKNKLLKTAKKNNTRLIFNLDISAEIDFLNFNKTEKEKLEKLKNNSLEILDEISDYIAAVKINRPFTDAVGLEFIKNLKQFNLPLIADFKLADIDNTSKWISRHAFNAGFDAIIAHAFTGEDSISAIVDVATEKDKGVILVVNMSHPGSREFITPNSDAMCEIAKKFSVSGVVAPATRPGEISRVREIIGNEILILSPGVGAQGGSVGGAIAAGADFEMVGRIIYNSENPGDATKKISMELKFFTESVI